MAESPASNRPLPSPVAPASDRPRVSTRAAAGTDASKSAFRRFGSLASTFAKKVVVDAAQAYRESRLQTIKSKEMEVAAANVLRISESVELQDRQNDILAKIIAELKGLDLNPDGAGGELPGIGGGRPRPRLRGRRGRFGARGRERLRRMRAAQRVRRVQAIRQQISRQTQAVRQAVRETVTRVRPPVQPRPTRIEPTIRAPSPAAAPRPILIPPVTPSPRAPEASRLSAQQLRAQIRSRIPAAARRAAVSSFRRIIPGLAIALAAIPVLNRLRNGDFVGAGIELGAALLGAIPVVGIAAGAAAATVNESREIYRELIGVYPENDPHNPEREEIFREIVIQVASYLSEAAEEQARSNRERVATRESGPAAGAAAEFYSDQPAPSQLGVQAGEEADAERSVREAQRGQERRVEESRRETEEIQRLWPEITEATRDVTDQTLLENLPRELSGGARIAERELWLRRQRYQLYLDRSRRQSPDASAPVRTELTPPQSAETAPDSAARPVPVPVTRPPTGGSTTSGIDAPDSAARPVPVTRPPTGGTTPSVYGNISRVGRAVFGGVTPRATTTPSTSPISQVSAPAQRTATVPVTPSISGGGTSTSASTGTITEVVERGSGFNVVRYDDGRIERRTGARNWRNNNPGNIEFGDFARRQGAIGTDGRFAIFPTYDVGRRAKEALLFEGRNYSGLTIAQAITRYAPPSENDTAMYIRVAAAAAGVAPTTMMRDLNSGQRQALLAAMERIEGFRVGSVQVIQQGTAVASAEQAPPGPGPALAAEGAQMAAADQAQARGQGQEVVVQIPPASLPQRIVASEQQASIDRGEVSLNRRLEKQVA